MMANKNLLALILLALSLANIVNHYLAGHAFQDQLFNADALYLPALFSDFLTRNGDIRDWFLTPAPYFFPDYPAFFLAYLVGSGPYGQIVAFSLIQTALTFAAIWFLAKQTQDSNALFTAAAIAIALIWLALTSGEPFILLLNSAHHYGIFVIAIVFIALWMQHKGREERQSKGIDNLLIIILAFFSSLSDGLFIVQVIVPLAATVILVSIVERDFSFRPNLLLVLAVTSGFLGSISYKLIVTNQTRYPANIGLGKISENLTDIYTAFYSVVAGSPIVGVLFLCYMGVVLYSFFLLLSGAATGNKLSWLAIFSFLSLCATLAAVSLTTNLPVTKRYLIPALSWPVIVVFLFLSTYLSRKFVAIAATISILATASLSWGSYKLIEKNGLDSRYYPVDVSCIDDVLAEEQITNGIAQYYDAKYLQNFSRLDLNIAQHLDNLNEMYWITSKRYFKQSYDFAIISERAEFPYKISSEALIRLNGAPKLVKSCGDRSIYIYGKDKLRVRKIVDIGDSYTWKACELPTRIGEKTDDCGVQTRDNPQAGHLTFGPYEQLPAGRYRFDISYSSAAGQADTVGAWDLVVALPSEAKILKNGVIAGTNGSVEEITGEFALHSDHDMEKIEIRTLAQQNVDLKVIYIRVERVQ